MKTIVKIATAALLAVAAMSCKQAPKYALTDGQWVLISWNDVGGQEQMVVENRPTMQFAADALVSGSAGCNRFSGRYEVNNEMIVIDLGAMTRMMCLDMTLENRMVEQMPNVDRFEIDGNQLILFGGENELFRFDNQVVDETTPTAAPATEPVAPADSSALEAAVEGTAAGVQ